MKAIIMSRIFKRVSWLLLTGALLFTTACGDSKEAKAAAPQAMPVKVQTAKDQKVDDTTDYVATLKSRDSAVVMPQVEGIITQIFVHSGERVAAGAPMMQIDPAKQQATVNSEEHARAAQEAQLKWAQQNYERVSGLANAGVVSKQDLDQARATLDAAQAQLHSLDAQVNEQTVQLHYYQVVAPRAGIVGDVPVRVGDRVLTTTNLATVDRPGSLEAYIYVPIERSGQLKMNLPVEIVDDSGRCLPRAASRSFRHRWIPRPKPCSPKRRSRTQTTACVRLNSYEPESSGGARKSPSFRW